MTQREDRDMNILQSIKRATASPVVDQRRLAREFASAFPAASYRVQIVPRVAGNGVSRRSFEHDFDGLLRLVDSGKLAHDNANGGCIFIRPARRDLVLLDDLPPHAAAQLECFGFSPAAIIQSSPAKTNVILKIPTLDPNPSPDAYEAHYWHTTVQKKIVEHLRENFGMPADAAAARDLQVWRAPGFSNQKRDPSDTSKLKYSPLFYARTTLLKPDAVPHRALELVERWRKEAELDAEAPARNFVGFTRAGAGEVDASLLGKSAALIDVEKFDNAARAEIARRSSAGEDRRTIVVAAPAEYIEAGLVKIRNAEEGSRRATLLANGSAYFRMSAGSAENPGYRKAAGFDPAELADRLAVAGIEAGLEHLEVQATVRWAAAYGARDPIFPDVVGLGDALERVDSVAARAHESDQRLDAREAAAKAATAQKPARRS